MKPTTSGMSKAAVTDPDGTTAVREIPIPGLGSETGLLRVEASGICGTDMGLAHNGELPVPTILGHHIIGRIEGVGELAAQRWGVAAGDLVAVQEYLPCRDCVWCERKEFRLCARSDFWQQGRRFGLIAVAEEPCLWGGNAEYLHLPSESIVHVLPPMMDVGRAVWLLPLANAFDWTVDAPRLLPGENVVIFGPGQHGVACVVAALEGGAGKVTLVGTNTDGRRLEIAKRLGAETVMIEDGAAPQDQVDLKSMRGEVDVAVNTAGGAGRLLPALIDLVGMRGRVIQAGVAAGARPELDLAAVGARALSVLGVRGRSGSAIDRAVASLNAESHPLDAVDTLSVGIDDIDALLSPRHAMPAADRPLHIVVNP
jgi:threonine dehydrogenase-like Zn-dependent dehydrogenase